MKRKMSFEVLVPSIVSIVVVSAFGCAAPTTDGAGTDEAALGATSLVAEAPSVVDGVEVASVTTRAGSRVRFVAGEGNELGVELMYRTGATDAVLAAARASVTARDPVAFYERLAGSPAPEALVKAAREASLAAPEPTTLDSELPFDPSLVAGAGPMAAPIPGNFCDISPWAHSGSGAYERCWPNQTGTTKLKKKVDHMGCRIDAIQGPISIRYKYKTASGWHTPTDVANMPAGWTFEWNGYYQYAKRWRECHVYANAGAKLHHFRAGGHENLAPLGFSPASVSYP